MALPLYLAQTAAEMAGNPLPSQPAYMACHFSPGGKGLSNLPEKLPPGSMLILDDSTPMDGHDPETILAQLSSQKYACILLDFQRPGIDAQRKLVEILVSSLPCPVGVSELYAKGLSCPLFLPPVPPDRPLAEYVEAWKGRDIWLEAALDGITLTLTEDGCTTAPLFDLPIEGFRDDHLHCHYCIETDENAATFHLWRTQEDLDDLLAEAESLGIAKAIGLWQELGR